MTSNNIGLWMKCWLHHLYANSCHVTNITTYKHFSIYVTTKLIRRKRTQSTIHEKKLVFYLRYCVNLSGKFGVLVNIYPLTKAQFPSKDELPSKCYNPSKPDKYQVVDSSNNYCLELDLYVGNIYEEEVSAFGSTHDRVMKLLRNYLSKSFFLYTWTIGTHRRTCIIIYVCWIRVQQVPVDHARDFHQIL